jgi:predicted nucleotidyltransferase
MTEDLKNLILKAADVLQKYGAEDVFFFGSVAKSENPDDTSIDLAVSGLSPDVFYQAMGAVLSVTRRRCNLVDLDENTSYIASLKSLNKEQIKIGDKISRELHRLHETLDVYRPLIDKATICRPNTTEMVALAGILQLLYSGFNNIFKLIITEFDSGFKKSVSHEADVLERMVMPTPKRSPVINKILMEQLLPYMAFRHAFHDNHPFSFSWEKMRRLIVEAEEILVLVEAELNSFIEANC